MNYLAHLALSGNNEGVIIGNFIGDSLKGVKIENYSEEIKKGIKLHRFIDDFTDHHAIFIETKKIFSPIYDKYSAVLVDIFFDHFLATNFNLYHEVDLQKFSFNCYDLILKYYEILPEDAKRFYHYMKKYNILYEYKNLDSLKFVLEGLHERTGKKSSINQS
ncbi:MAG: ACP phosphodiesterase, partial [Bacteroidota bacterium]